MRKWQPPGVPALQEWKVIYQIVLPHLYQSDVLSLVNKTAMAGYLGVNKTYQSILDHLYWPEVSKEVKQYFQTCTYVSWLGGLIKNLHQHL